MTEQNERKRKAFLINTQRVGQEGNYAQRMPKINTGVSVRKFNTGETTNKGIVGNVNGKPVVGNIASNISFIGKPSQYEIMLRSTEKEDEKHPQLYPSLTDYAKSRRTSVNESISPDKPSKAPVAKGLDFPQQPKREKPLDDATAQVEAKKALAYNTSRGRKIVSQMKGSDEKIQTNKGIMTLKEAIMRKPLHTISKRGETTKTTIGIKLGAVMSEGDQTVNVRYAKNDTLKHLDISKEGLPQSKPDKISAKKSFSRKQTTTGMTNLLGGGVRIGALRKVNNKYVARSRALRVTEANNIEIYKNMLDADPKTGIVDLDKPHIVDERQDIKKGEIRLGYSQGTGNAFGSTRVANPARKALERQGSKLRISRNLTARQLINGVKLPGQDEKKAELIRTGQAYEKTKKVNYVPTTTVHRTVPVDTVSNKPQGQFRSKREKLLGTVSKLQTRVDSGTASENDVKTLAGLKKKHNIK